MRPIDWEPLHHVDPVPGDPEALSGLVDELVGVAAAVREQRSRLDCINTDDIWDSDAARHFAERQADLPPELDRIATRYDNVADALARYHPALAEAQRDSHTALVRAREAQADLERARSGVEEMRSWTAREEADAAAFAAECGAPVVPDPWPGEDHEALLADAEQRLEAERAALADIVEAVQQAAGRAVQVIAQAIDDDLRDPGGFQGWVQNNADTLDALSNVLGTLSGGIGVVAIFVPVLAPVSFALDAAAFTVDLGLVLGGESDLDDLLISGAGLLAGAGARGFSSSTEAARGAGTAAGAVGDARQAATLGHHTLDAVHPRALVAEFGEGVGAIREVGLAKHVGDGLSGLAKPFLSGDVPHATVHLANLGLTSEAAYDQFVAGKQIAVSLGGRPGMGDVDLRARVQMPSFRDPALTFEGGVEVRVGSQGGSARTGQDIDPVAVPPVPAAAGAP